MTALVLVAGCDGSSSAPAAESSASSAEPTAPAGDEPATSITTLPDGRCREGSAAEIVVWHALSSVPAREVLETQVEEFTAVHPDVGVTLERIEDGDILGRLLSTPTAQWPDALLLSPQTLPRLIGTGAVVPPAACPSALDQPVELLPSVREHFSLEGELQALPYGVSTTLLWFDAAKFRKAGLDPADPPATLDELSRASEQLVSSGASPKGLVVYDWFFRYLAYTEAARRSEAVIEPQNGRIPGDQDAALNTELNTRLAEWIDRVTAAPHAVWIGGIPNGIENLVRIGVGDDRGAITFHTSASLGDILALVEGGQFPGTEVAVAPLPGIAGNRGGVLGGNGFVVLDGGSPDDVGAASIFARWMTQPSNIARLAAATGYIPTSKAAADDPLTARAWKARPVLRVGYDVASLMPAGALSAEPAIGPAAEVEELMWSFTTSIAETDADPGEALARLDADVDRLLDNFATGG